MSNNNGEASAVEAVPDTQMIDGARQRRASLIRAWWPVVVGIAVIVLESTPWGGADHTSGPLRWVYEHLFGAVGDDSWDAIHHYIRKTGHFVGYGLLCLMWLRAWWLSFPRFGYLRDAALAILGTAVIASGDEFHQRFLPNRGSSPWDVLLDCCGAAFMTLIVWAILRVFRMAPFRS